MRRAPAPRWPLVGFFLAAACGGAIGQAPPTPASTDARFPPEAFADNAAVCPHYDYGTIPSPPPSCKVEARGCPNDSTVDKGCLPTRFFGSLQPYIADCDVKVCADLAVAFAGGCVTELVLPRLMHTDAGPAVDLSCLRAALIGTHWSCAPPDGWAQFPLTTCP